MADTIAYTRQLSEVCEIESDEERIKQSKRHWTQHPEPAADSDNDAIVVETLQKGNFPSEGNRPASLRSLRGKSKRTGGVPQRGQPNESSTRISSACCDLLRRLWRRRSTCFRYLDSDSSEEVEPDSDSGEEVEPDIDSGEEVEPDSDSGEEVEPDSDSGEEVEPNNDEEVFEALQRNPDWGTFFHRFRECELVMAEKPFAVGGQAEVYAAQIKWFNSSPSEEELKHPWKWVLKVFKKKGQPLQALQKQWPQGMLQFQKERCHVGSVRRYNCDVVCGTLLEDGRFAFLMQREKEDLRHCIERNMKSWSPTAWIASTISPRGQFGPFPQEVAERFMYEIALGMKWLHDRGILHRDLKASNVLLSEDKGQSYCFVADYECSEWVVGTHFWRAPEILKAIQSNLNSEERRKLFTKGADVYSFGMTCYEILTGKMPFEGHMVNNYDVVLKGKSKLEIPNYVAKWLQELLSSCWQFDPKERPTFEKILEEFKEHGGSCTTEDYTHSKHIWSQLIMTIRMSMVIKLEEFWTWSAPSHWTELTDWDDEHDDSVEVFQALQRHPEWGSFFRTFGYDTEVFLSSGLLEVGEKIAEGGQAEIFKVHVKWISEETNDYDQKNNREWVLKVYRKGYRLRDLQPLWSDGLFSYYADRVESTKRGYGLKPRNVCDVVCGMLLEDGRFAHLLERYGRGDLRQVIDIRRSGYDGGPFSKEVAEGFIFDVALGMDWLHSYDIVHRDLKASNVLVTEDRDGQYQCFVCDYECSYGVVGTGFWRAPEILQATKDRRIASNPELFTKAIDVYGFGMTCYEILTGELPFRDLRPNNYEVVLSGGRPEVPEYVDTWTHELLSLCWQADPATRPSFKEILDLILANSAVARRLNEIRGDKVEVGHFFLPLSNDEIFLGESFLGRILGEE